MILTLLELVFESPWGHLTLMCLIYEKVQVYGYEYPFINAKPIVPYKRVLMPDLKDLITTEEAARILQFHGEHVRRLIGPTHLGGSGIP